jgi:hypothetical protein
MPTFCRHNRFIERCPICKRSLPSSTAATGSRRSSSSRSSSNGSGAGISSQATRGSLPGRPGSARSHRRLRSGGQEVKVRRETRAEDDGYACGLVPGLHASADAARLAEEIAFASGRLSRMHAAPPDLLGEIRALAEEGGEEGLERASWMCFLTVYISPLQGDDPFAGVRLLLERERMLVAGEAPIGEWDSPLDGIPLGPRTSHDPARGSQTLHAYRQWALHAGSQVRGIVGEEAWTPERRFERAFERLALPGFGRLGRYELLVTLGRLGLYDLRAESLHLSVGGRAGTVDGLATVAAKRVLAVGEPIYLERRAVAFAQELSLSVDVLDLAFANWGAGERATLGFKADMLDSHTLEHVREALEL